VRDAAGEAQPRAAGLCACTPAQREHGLLGERLQRGGEVGVALVVARMLTGRSARARVIGRYGGRWFAVARPLGLTAQGPRAPRRACGAEQVDEGGAVGALGIEEVVEITRLEPQAAVGVDARDALEQLAIARRAVRGEAHDLVLVAVDREAEPRGEPGVEQAE
jgi:hypothetical protein